MNIFANEAIKSANMTVTENGHPAATTTGSAVLDLYGVAGALRGQDEDRIFDLFDKAYMDDPLLTARTLFYMRDCRGGTGERETFRKLLTYAAKKYPDILDKNIKLIPEYGRWDDMYALVGTRFEDEIFSVFTEQLGDDILNLEKADQPVSLMAKWLKSCNTSSEESRKLGKLTWKKMGFVNERAYRKTLAKLREHIRIVEAQMSANRWKDIEYDKLPSRAGMIYRNAFRKHDEDRYNDYIESVKKGEKKINVAMNTPQDLVHCYMSGRIPREEDPTVEAMWKNLPDYIQSDENVLCMVDVSGSMYGRPIEISTGLGMYFAQKNRGAFHNLFMTFDDEPRFMSLDDNLSFLENLRTVFDAPWGGSTDLNLACKEMLRFAVEHKVPQEDMPTRLIIISDMEINAACGHYVPSWAKNGFPDTVLQIDELRQMYEAAGYSMPQVIYWNAESRDNHFHTRSDVPGTMLASGSSPAVFEAVMKMKDLDVTPLDAMLEVLNGERYSRIAV